MSPLKYFRAWSCPVKLLFFLTIMVLMSLACLELFVVLNTPQPTILAATLTASPNPSPTNTPAAILGPTPVVVVISPTPTLYTPPLITPDPPTATSTTLGDIENVYTGLSLVSPAPGMKFPANIETVEFQWKWEVKPQCGAPRNDHGFLVQVWRQDSDSPMGVFDAVKDRRYIPCSPETGIYSYRLNNLKDAPGVGRGEPGVGPFYWNVAYVQLNPFKVISQSAPNAFEITLEYIGPLDPHGFDLNCSDFASWGEAQAIFMAAGGPEQDPHGLDPDTNSYACDQIR